MTESHDSIDASPLGLERGLVSLAEHEPAWRDAATAELVRLEARFVKAGVDGRVLGYEHVGSTAVPGLAAKPILDLLVVIADPGGSALLGPELESMGYTHRPNDEVTDRAFFAKGPTSNRTHYLSVTQWGSDCHREQVTLRDYLRDNPAALERYERRKRQLVAEHADDRAAYTARKTAVIEELLEQADAAGYGIGVR